METQLSHPQIIESGEVEIIHVVRQLLEFCDENRQAIHRDMNRIESRFAKNRIRCWIALVIQLGEQNTRLKPIQSRVINAFLANERSVRGLIAFVSRELSTVDVARLWPSSTSTFQAVKASLPMLADGIDPDLKFDCHAATIARAIAMAVSDVYAKRPQALFQSATTSRPTPLGKGDLFPVRRFEKDDLDLRYGLADYNLDHIEDDAGQLMTIRRLSQSTLPITLFSGWKARDFERLFVEEQNLVVGFACLGPMGDYTSPHRQSPSATHEIGQMDPPHPFSPHLNERLPERPDATAIGTFFGVSYSEQGALLKIFEKACAGKVDILIYPELAMSEGTYNQILKRMAEAHAPPRMVVFGSRHIVETIPNRLGTREPLAPNAVEEKTEVRPKNRLQVTDSQSGVTFIHDKIGTFGFWEKRDRCYYFERIIRDRNITVINAGGMPTAFVICKDILQSSVIDALQFLRIKHLVVVAMSPKTAEFVQHLSEFAVRSNTRSFFCCFSNPGEVTAGVFAPVKDATSIVLRNASDEPQSNSNAPNYCENAGRITKPSLACFSYPIPARPHPSEDQQDPAPQTEASSPFVTGKWFTITEV